MPAGRPGWNPVLIQVEPAILQARMSTCKLVGFGNRPDIFQRLPGDKWSLQLKKVRVVDGAEFEAIVDVNCVTSSWVNVVWRNPDY